ncbi:hypothetical protein Cantr_10124 [Candida viswanathii]|uniref:Uncharacterized protein n=1 Tax=Candida viswanathii TaxID=5486 RepID=A0A367YC46_9ASCO|nr:hypothetical protein Cantr_07991 [Candida viswanathii]RCK63443.1 hypothetical protein Cantr_10124 [Candida viswanathii]
MTTTSRQMQSPEMIFERWVDQPFAPKHKNKHYDCTCIPLDTTAPLDATNETTEVKIYRRNSALALNSLNAALSRKSSH